MRTATQEAFDNLTSVITSSLDLGEFDLDGAANSARSRR